MIMTREEAISILEESKRQNKVMIDNPSMFWRASQMASGVKNAEQLIMALDMAIAALRPVSREQVEKVCRGAWIDTNHRTSSCKCTKCGAVQEYETPFCPYCGAPLTDEAMDLVIDRLEALKDADD